jgi:hypothetical protein
MGNLEALGDAVTGGVMGRAVEPKAGEASGGHTHERNCLNCGALLTGPYCHECGQHAHVHRTLSAFFHDFLHGVLHFEGKIWRTLPLLAWKPGELTRRYIDGQRASFVSPIALFLFCVFLMFASVSLFSHVGEVTPKVKRDIAAELRTDQQKLAQLNAARTAAEKAGQPTAKFNEQIGDLKDEIKALETVRSGGNALQVDKSGMPDWLQGVVAEGAKNPELVVYKLKTNAYKFSWLIIPLSVPFVWLLFPFSRRFRPYDHTVFVTYSLCFMTLLVVAGVLFGAVGLASIAGLLWLLPPFHMYRQLKGAYGLSTGGALWRASLLTIFALIVIGLFAALLVGVGLFD